MVVTLARELDRHNDNFDNFWDNVIQEILLINESVNNNPIIMAFNTYVEIEAPENP